MKEIELNNICDGNMEELTENDVLERQNALAQLELECQNESIDRKIALCENTIKQLQHLKDINIDKIKKIYEL